MENRTRIIVFICLFGFMIVSLFVKIPPLLNNILYGTMAIIALFFILTNREKVGLKDIFKKEEEEEQEETKK